MPEKERILALGKVLIAAAWADHEISLDEINHLKDLLFRLPEMTSEDWARLQMYIDDPVGDAERERLVADLARQIRSKADLEWMKDALEDFVAADGDIAQDEMQIVKEIEAELEAGNTSILEKLGRTVSGSLNRREQISASAPNREEFFEDYISNKVYYALKIRLNQTDLDLDLSDHELRRLTLAGGLLARVAHADGEVTDSEFEAIASGIERYWDLSSVQASFVAEAAVSETSLKMDYFRMTREFFDSTTEMEKVRFLSACFTIARSDGDLSYAETEEIRRISKSLLLSHRQFIEAKTEASSQQV